MSDSATPWTVAHQAPLSMGFSRLEYWSGLPFPSPGDLPNPGMEPRSPALQADFFTVWSTTIRNIENELWIMQNISSTGICVISFCFLDIGLRDILNFVLLIFFSVRKSRRNKIHNKKCLPVPGLELTATFVLIKRWKVSWGKESKEFYQSKSIHVFS